MNYNQYHNYNKNIVCNVINPDDPSTIMVKFDDETFSFYDNKNQNPKGQPLFGLALITEV